MSIRKGIAISSVGLLLFVCAIVLALLVLRPPEMKVGVLIR